MTDWDKTYSLTKGTGQNDGAYLTVKRVRGGWIIDAMFGGQEVCKSAREVVLVLERWLGIQEEPKT